jgi:hypothetical protein
MIKQFSHVPHSNHSAWKEGEVVYSETSSREEKSVSITGTGSKSEVTV